MTDNKLLEIIPSYLSNTIVFLTTKYHALITGRNEVVAKVMFLLVSVILSTGGGSVSVHAGNPPRQGDPPCQGDPPGKQTPA